MLFIHNVTLLTPRQRVEKAGLLVDRGGIVACGPIESMHLPENLDFVDGGGHLLAPGFLDLQVNGGFGLDFTADPTTIWAVGERLPRYGVTAFLPTIITAPLAVSRAAQDVLLAGPPPGYRGAIP
nr:N-acetylglucosamine-6-phosphate deacetylase [Caldilineaceae bacterium]